LSTDILFEWFSKRDALEQLSKIYIGKSHSTTKSTISPITSPDVLQSCGHDGQNAVPKRKVRFVQKKSSNGSIRSISVETTKNSLHEYAEAILDNSMKKVFKKIFSN
jgi:hypothetical protein